MDKNLSPKIPLSFNCFKCNYICYNKKDFNKHLSTRKHELIKTDNEKTPEIPLAYSCLLCNKSYKYQSGLCKHKKTCTKTNIEDPQYNELVNKLFSDNYELRNFIVEQSKTIEKIMIQNTEVMNKTIECCKQTSTTINNNIKNENKSFNINVFLNEQCKDAINFTDFIKNIEISHQDLENNAQLGFVNGISKIFLDNLKQLGVNERPFHCTDAKRETMYIKDENSWQKQTDDEKLQKAIQTVSYRSMGKLQEWKQENPDYQDVDSEFSKKCMDIHKQTIAGSDREVYYPKVIHVLAKETMVDK